MYFGHEVEEHPHDDVSYDELTQNIAEVGLPAQKQQDAEKEGNNDGSWQIGRLEKLRVGLSEGDDTQESVLYHVDIQTNVYLNWFVPYKSGG